MGEKKPLKRLIIGFEIIIVVVFVMKIGVAGGILKHSTVLDRFFSVNSSCANTEAFPEISQRTEEVYEDNLEKERELFAALLKKKQDLDNREAMLENEKNRLEELKTEIMAKIETLQTKREELGNLIETIKAVDDQKFKGLAKVYESTPPAQASAMLEKLDKKTAASIIMNMKSKNAGEIWGYMQPQKAVEITKEITNINLSAGKRQ